MSRYLVHTFSSLFGPLIRFILNTVENKCKSCISLFYTFFCIFVHYKLQNNIQWNILESRYLRDCSEKRLRRKWNGVSRTWRFRADLSFRGCQTGGTCNGENSRGNKITRPQHSSLKWHSRAVVGTVSCILAGPSISFSSSTYRRSRGRAFFYFHRGLYIRRKNKRLA